MNEANKPLAAVQDASSVLDSIGNWILSADTRWVVIIAGVMVLLIGIYLAIKHRALTTDASIHLGLTLAQIYSAAAIFAVLVLTEPPALGKLDAFARQSAGFIAFIVLIMGVWGHVQGLFGRIKAPADLDKKLQDLAVEVSNLGKGQLSGDELKKKANELATLARNLAADSSNLVNAAAKISGRS
jgi:hypothetical protein